MFIVRVLFESPKEDNQPTNISSFVTVELIGDLFAKRLKRESETLPQQITRAWQLCFQRTPSDEELSDSEEFIKQEGIQQFTRAMLNANELVFIP